MNSQTEQPHNRLEETADHYFAGAMIFVLALFGVYLFILFKQKRLTLKNLVTRIKIKESEKITLCERKRLSPDSVLYVIETEYGKVMLVESTKSITVLSKDRINNDQDSHLKTDN